LGSGISHLFNFGELMGAEEFGGLAGGFDRMYDSAMRLVGGLWNIINTVKVTAAGVQHLFEWGERMSHVEFGGVSRSMEGVYTWVMNVASAMHHLNIWITAVIVRIGQLAAQFMKLSIPSWLVPGSPTPLEKGLRGIESAMGSLASSGMPAFTGTTQSSGFSGGVVVNLTYAPAVSLADRAEVETRIVPMIDNAIRRYNRGKV